MEIKAILKPLNEVDLSKNPTIVAGMYHLFDGVTPRNLKYHEESEYYRLDNGYWINPEWIQGVVTDEIDKIFNDIITILDEFK